MKRAVKTVVDGAALALVAPAFLLYLLGGLVLGREKGLSGLVAGIRARARLVWHHLAPRLLPTGAASLRTGLLH